jgi:hypothetical protein
MKPPYHWAKVRFDPSEMKLDEPSDAQVKAAIAAFADGSIADFSVAGHGNPIEMYFSKDRSATGPGLFCNPNDNNRVYYNSGDSFADSIRTKLMKGATIHYRGCNTAAPRIWTWRKNISKQTAFELTGTHVWGSVTWRVGPLYICGYYTGCQSGLTIPMEYTDW